MKTVLLIVFAILAVCFGIVLVGLGALFVSSSGSVYLNANEEFWTTPIQCGNPFLGFLFGFIVACAGALLTLSGFVLKSRLIVIPLILVGLLYCFSTRGAFYGTYMAMQHPQVFPEANYGDFLTDIELSLPGLYLNYGRLYYSIV